MTEENKSTLDPIVIQEIMDRLHKKLWTAFDNALEQERFMEGPTPDEKVTAIFTYLIGLQSSVLGSMVLAAEDITVEVAEETWTQFASNLHGDFMSRLELVKKQINERPSVIEDAVVLGEDKAKPGVITSVS